MPGRVFLAISSFRSDEAVARLLTTASALVPRVFSGILVVDSLGSGKIPVLIDQRGWRFVTYHSADVNLGSAGNLARRLEFAGRSDADYVYALNHDGVLCEPTIMALLAGARQVDRLGAAYPLRILSNRNASYDVTGASRLLLPTRTRQAPPSQDLLDVYWGSSNGTLYALEPVRQGLLPWADLWMGWEDLGYGWLLHQNGFRQVIVRDAVFEDNYEFESIGRMAGLSISRKPPWYAYYMTRNLILIGRRLRPAWDVRASFGARIAIEYGSTALLRQEKWQRMGLMTRGVWDGLLSRSGKRN